MSSIIFRYHNNKIQLLQWVIKSLDKSSTKVLDCEIILYSYIKSYLIPIDFFVSATKITTTTDDIIYAEGGDEKEVRRSQNIIEESEPLL